MNYKYRIYGWRDGLNSRPMAMTHTVEQAAKVAVQMQAELMAFDATLTGLGPCNVRVEEIESQWAQAKSDLGDAQLMAQDAAQWEAAKLATRINMAREGGAHV